MSLSADQFAKALITAGLSSADEIKSIWSTLPSGKRPKDGEAFAKVLIEREKLTQFQATELLSGSTTPLLLGDYVLLAKIGAGGMGQVFKARHQHMDRLAAIKLLPPAMTKDQEAVKRFQREVKAAAKLSHPNIVQTYDAGVQRGVWYLVMEYVEGRDLAGVVAAEGLLPVARAVDCIRQAAKGLAFAHKNGVVHRDIKPANLLLDQEGTVKILDMGLARLDDGAVAAAKDGLTQSGQVMGTIDYMAPEQAFDTRHADARADVYSLGCTLYRLLTGANLFEGESLVQKLLAHQQQPAPDLSQRRADAPRQLDTIFRKMVAKKPEERYQTMAEVEAALATLAFGTPVGSAAAPEVGSKFSAFFRSVTGQGKQPPAASGVAVLASPEAATSPAVGDAPTMALASPLQVTDPVSERSVQIARGQPPQPAGAKKPPFWRQPLILAAGGLGAALLLMLGIWVIIRDKEGKEVGRIKVPEGGKAEVVEDNGAATKDSPPLANAPALKRQEDADLLKSGEYFWTVPENLEVAADMHIICGISPDELIIYDWRPGKGLFALRRTAIGKPFAEPQDLGLNPKLSTCTSVSANGLIAAGYRETEGAAWQRELWLSTRKSTGEAFSPPVDLPAPVNELGDDVRPALSADGRTLLFSSTRSGSQSAEVWIATRESVEEPFNKPDLLPDPVNSEFWEMPFWISNARTELIVSRQYIQQNPTRTLREFRFFTRETPTGLFRPGTTLDLPLNPATAIDTTEGFLLSADQRSVYFTPMINNGVWVCRLQGKSTSTAQTSWHGWPADAPKPAIAPFDAAQANKHQEEWAAYLKVPVEHTNSLGMKFRLIPPGEFLMGSDAKEVNDLRQDPRQNPLWQQGLLTETPRHRVVLTQPMFLGAHEVSQADYLRMIGSNPSEFATAPDAKRLPVEGVGWSDATQFCELLSGQEKLSSCYAVRERSVVLLNGSGYRLPTESQWEFACRGGTTTRFWVGNDEAKLASAAWLKENSEDRPHPAGELRPNAFGLFDMLGNVNEWVEDAWGEDRYRQFEKQAALDARSPVSSPVDCERVVRGGAFHDAILAARSAVRYNVKPATGYHVGFRVALTVDAVRQATKTTGPALPPITSGAMPPFPGTLLDAALQFDGDDVVEIPSLTFDPQGSYTLEGFITSPTKADKGAGFVFGMPLQSYLSFTKGSDWRWVYVPHNRTPGLEMAIAGAAARQERTHLACVRDGQTHRLYVDGKLFHKTAEVPSPAVGASPFQIGPEFRGVIDEVQISMVARYKADFTSPDRFTPDADTLGLYHFDEATGDVLKDSSGHNHHGKITGATWVHRDGSAAESVSQQWLKDVAALPAAKQVEEVDAKLKALNPEFKGQLGVRYDGQPAVQIEEGAVVALAVDSAGLVDLSPLRAFPKLKSFAANTQADSSVVPNLATLQGLSLESLHLDLNRNLSDLGPLAALPLTELNLFLTKVEDLRPLAGMKLKRLGLRETPVRDLAPLKGMPLETLDLNGVAGALDLAPLANLPLKALELPREVTDVTPLKGLPLTFLSIDARKLADLTGLEGLRLKRLHLMFSQGDLTPLENMPLEELWLSECPETIEWRSVGKLKGLKSLLIISTKISPQNLAALKKVLPECQIDVK